MRIFIFGNGNVSFQRYLDTYYATILENHSEHTSYIVCDFRGVDTLTMEVLKLLSPKVTVFHVGKRPRYTPDKFGTHVDLWKFVGGYKGDHARDEAAIAQCTHFLAFDQTSTATRKSGTLQNIEKCLAMDKHRLLPRGYSGEILVPGAAESHEVTGFAIEAPDAPVRKTLINREGG
jgi:hypothetical protein